VGLGDRANLQEIFFYFVHYRMPTFPEDSPKNGNGSVFFERTMLKAAAQASFLLVPIGSLHEILYLLTP
jgi:hypothetical protein